MKICFIASGISIHSKKWANFFSGNGHEVHVISNRFNSGWNANIHLHPLVRVLPEIWNITRYPSVLLWPLQVRMLLNKIKPDIFHAHYVTMCGYLAAFSNFHPFLMTAWGSDILVDPKQSNFYRILTGYTLKKADLISCDADFFVEKLMEFGAKKEKIKIIYFGVDVEKFKPGKKDNNLLDSFGFLNSPVIISLRNLKPIYDVETLINAMSLVLKEVPDVKVFIAGNGEQREYLERLASPLGKSIKFIGAIPNDDLPKYITSSDLYVSTSLSDAGLSACTAEVMACGLPAIITDFGDNRKWIQDGVNGFIVPLRDPESLASRIVYLIRNENERKKLGAANRRIIEEKNNWEREMSKMESFYKELIDKNKKQ